MTIALRKNNPKLSFYGGFYDIKMSDGVREHKKIVVCGCTFPWILFFFFSGLTIECFQCNSVEHPGCVDLTINDTSSRYYRECDGDYQGHEPFCRKVATESKLYTQKKKKLNNDFDISIWHYLCLLGCDVRLRIANRTEGWIETIIGCPFADVTWAGFLLCLKCFVNVLPLWMIFFK